MHIRRHEKCPLFLPDINLNFLDSFSKNKQISDLMKIRLVGVEWFHADKQPD